MGALPWGCGYCSPRTTRPRPSRPSRCSARRRTPTSSWTGCRRRPRRCATSRAAATTPISSTSRSARSSGLDVLKQAIEAGCQAPIVLLAEFGEGGRDTEALRLGAADFLVKGETTAPQLRRAIAHAIERARVSRALRESEARLLQASAPRASAASPAASPTTSTTCSPASWAARPRSSSKIDADHPAREHYRRGPRTRRARGARSRGSSSPTAAARPSSRRDRPEPRRRRPGRDCCAALVGDHLTFDVHTRPTAAASWPTDRRWSRW